MQKLKLLVTLNVPQPFSPYLEDIYDHIPMITVLNPTNENLKIAMRFELIGDTKFVRTKPDLYSDDIMVQTRGNVVLNSTNFNYRSLIGRGAIEHNLSKSEEGSFTQSLVLPEGSYSYCVYLYRHKEDGSYEPIQVNAFPPGQPLCSYFQVLAVNPPVIINPMNNSTINGNAPLVFNWTIPAPLAPTSYGNIVYDLYLLETTGMENPQVEMANAMKYNALHSVKIPNIKSNSHTLIPQNLPFELKEGKEYAVLVQARDKQKKTFFKNNGKSSIITFTYKKRLFEEKILPKKAE